MSPTTHNTMLLSHARHRRLRLLLPLFPVSQFLGFRQPFSSIPIKPVAYPPKPKEETAPNQHSPNIENQPPRRNSDSTQNSDSSPTTSESVDPLAWTRRDVRFVKDVPKITPVAYPSRVAPLPEDRVEVPRYAEGEAAAAAQRDLRNEGRRIRSDAGMRGYLGLVEEEIIPFPTLIKVEKRPTEVSMDLTTAIRKVKANARKSFLETVEAHVNLGVDPRRSDQMVRGALTLPHGTGKTVRVAVFAEGVAANEAKAAGADVVGGDELIEQIKAGGGKINFDKCIATPMFMPRLSKIGKILGPRGLMPNPKLGSVTNDVSGAVKAAKCGRIDFKIDKTAIVHAGLGKVNFTVENLHENVGAFVNALLAAKPVGLKKTSKYVGYVKNFTLCSSMGPGFSVTIQSLSTAADLYTKAHAS